MSDFFKKPPDCVSVLGKEYKINTDFRMWLEICDVLSRDISIKEKLCFLLVNSYCSVLPPDMEAAVNAVIEFMNMGAKKGKSKRSEKIIDFKLDQNLIYAAFMQQYSINLFSRDLHWWEFTALLSALDENTVFMRVVGYRSADLGKIRDEKQRRFYRKMKQQYRIDKEITDSIMVEALTVGGLGGLE